MKAEQRKPPLEAALARDRVVIGLGLLALTVLSWVYLLAGAGTGMQVWHMSTWSFPPPAPSRAMFGPWDAGYWIIMFVMWWVMMIAMMVPSAAPTVLLYARVARHAPRRSSSANVSVNTGWFTSGYLVVWAVFSLAATVLQYVLEQFRVVDGMMMWSTVPLLTGVLLVVAGVYQFTPFKRVCLDHCRSPAAFISQHWQTGWRGAFSMGVRHGAFCVGCCWGLMLLLFAGGIMNVVWIGGLAVAVLIEKVVPRGDLVGQIVGAALIVAGLVVIFAF